MKYDLDVVPPHITDDWIISGIIHEIRYDEEEEVILKISVWKPGDRLNTDTFSVLAIRDELINQYCPADCHSTDAVKAEKAALQLDFQLNKKPIADFKQLPLFETAYICHTLTHL